MTYYNTTRLNGTDLTDAKAKAATQDDLILAFFVDNQWQGWTPSEVHQRVFSQRTPLTSIRRSITNLTNQGSLVRLENMKDGPFGRPEHQWQYRDPNKPEQGRLL